VRSTASQAGEAAHQLQMVGRDDAVLDEYLSTVCRLRDGKIVDMGTYCQTFPA
jgi:hypothetical protein